jgi:hypothetical protein
MSKRALLAYLYLLLFGCYGANATPPPMHTVAMAPSMDTAGVEKALGLKGTTTDGVFRVNWPRQDLHVTMDGFPITPRMGLTAWFALRPSGHGAMLMGDIPLVQDELQPVLTALMANGLEVSGLHNHFMGEDARVMFLHVGGMGDPVALARGLRTAIDAIHTVRTATPVLTAPPALHSDLDAAPLNAIIGAKGDSQNGIYKVIVPRHDIQLHEMGTPVNSTMGFNSWTAIEGTAERAGASGELAMLADEVNPVVRSLRRSGIAVVAIHNHMLKEQPRLFFLHFWGVGRAQDLAKGFRAALERLHAPNP